MSCSPIQLSLLEAKFQHRSYFNFAQLLHIMNYLMFTLLEKEHSPSLGPQQALPGCFQGGSVKILIFRFRSSLWLYLESITENLPKLPLAATWTCSPIFCKRSENTDPNEIHNQLVRGLTLHFHMDDKSACLFLLDARKSTLRFESWSNH